MGSRDYYKKGDWNCICDVCGFLRKSSELRLRWDGLRVCQEDWEPRHPQDFVRGVPDSQSIPWSRPEAPDVFVTSTLRLQIEGGGNLLQEDGSLIYI